MIVSSPFSTVETLPETGASSSIAPRASIGDATARTVSGAIVLISSTTWPSCTTAATPSGPPYVSSTAASSARLEITTSAPSTASATVSAAAAPVRSATSWAAAAVRFQTRTGTPARRSVPTMAPPMRPAPTTATVIGSVM